MAMILDACCGSRMAWYDKDTPAGYLKDLEKGNGYAVRGWLLFQAPWNWIEDGRLIPLIVSTINGRLHEDT